METFEKNCNLLFSYNETDEMLEKFSKYNKGILSKFENYELSYE